MENEKVENVKNEPNDEKIIEIFLEKELVNNKKEITENNIKKEFTTIEKPIKVEKPKSTKTRATKKASKKTEVSKKKPSKRVTSKRISEKNVENDDMEDESIGFISKSKNPTERIESYSEEIDDEIDDEFIDTPSKVKKRKASEISGEITAEKAAKKEKKVYVKKGRAKKAEKKVYVKQTDTEKMVKEKTYLKEYLTRNMKYKEAYVVKNSKETILFPDWLVEKDKIQFIEDQVLKDQYRPKDHVIDFFFEEERKPQVKQLSFAKTSTSKISKKTSSVLINAGGLVKDIDWAPINILESKNSKQYIAVSAYNSSKKRYHTTQTQRHKNVIQIWEVDFEADESAKPAMFICTEYGAISKLKFVPQSCTSLEKNEESFNRIGLLACLFTDGKMRLFSVPKPEEAIEENIYCKIEPLTTLEVKKGNKYCPILSFDCSKSTRERCLIAVGCGDGSIACFNINEVYGQRGSKIGPLPLFHTLKDGGQILTVKFHPNNSDLFCTGSNSGRLEFWDVRSPDCPKDSHHQNNCWTTSISWEFADNKDVFVYTTANGGVNRLNTLVSSSNASFSNTQKLHVQISWQLSASPFSPHLASCSYDGTAVVVTCEKPRKKSCLFIGEHLMLNKITIHQLNEEKLLDDEEPTDPEKEIFIINENIEEMESHLKNVKVYTPYSAEDISIHCVSLNPNYGFQGLVASGSACGILRIQNISVHPNTYIGYDFDKLLSI